MSDSFKTKYVKGGYAEVAGEIELEKLPWTRTVFRRAFTPQGVHGQIVRQKVDENGIFRDINEVKFNTSEKNIGVKIEIPSEGLKDLAKDLYLMFKTRKELGVEFGEQDIVVGHKKDTIKITNSNVMEAIHQLIEMGYGEDVWKELSEKNPNLASKLSVARVQLSREAVIKEFEASLLEHPSDEKYWQEFINRHNWIIQMVFSSPVVYIDGEVYLGGKKAKGRNGVEGVATDFLCADDTSKSFAVVEIKKPDTELVGGQYRGKGGAVLYSASPDFSGAITQVRHQVQTAIEDFSSVLGKTYEDLNHVHPHSVIIIGIVNGLSTDKLRSFDYVRHALHGTTVITFDELLKRLRVVYGLH